MRSALRSVLRSVLHSMLHSMLHSVLFTRFNRSSGEKYMDTVLIHGGGRPPSIMVESLIGSKPTVDSLVEALVDETAKLKHYAMS